MLEVDPRVPKPDTADVLKDDWPAPAKLAEDAPNPLGLTFSLFDGDSAAKGDFDESRSDVVGGLFDEMTDVAPREPNGDVDDADRAANPEAAKADDDVWVCPLLLLDPKVESVLPGDVVLPRVPKGDSFEVFAKPLEGGI